MQIFHSIFWINDIGEHPPAFTEISLEEIEQGKWKINPAVAYSLISNIDIDLQNYALHYLKELNKQDKYLLTIWPYHAMLGSIGHALVPAVEEAIFFHSITRNVPPIFELKGNHPLTENYSVLRPEILRDATGRPIAQENKQLLEKLLEFDILIIAGQAKSHCVAWTVQDLLTEILLQDPILAQKVYLLEDCTSPVVIPGVIDFTEAADATFRRFAEAGMQLIKANQFQLP
jgi:nicotinamidase-related amidase